MGKNLNHQNQDIEQVGIIAAVGLGLVLFAFFAPVAIMSGVFSYLILAAYYEREERKWIRSIMIVLIGYILSKSSQQLFQSVLPYLFEGVFSKDKIQNILKNDLIRHADKLYFPFVLGGVYLIKSKVNDKLNRYVTIRELFIKSFHFFDIILTLISVPANMILAAAGIDTKDHRSIGSIISFIVVFIAATILVVPIGQVKHLSYITIFIQSLMLSYFLIYIYYVLTANSRDEAENINALNLRNEQGNIIIGRLTKPRRMDLKLSWNDINHHIHILGQPGAGKSILLRNIYSQQVMSGSGLLMIDLKADISVREDFKNLAALSGREEDLIIIDLSHPEISWGYNPLQFGNATELKDKIIGAIEWSEPHYKRTSERALLVVLRALVWVRDHKNLMPTLSDVLVALSSVQGMTALSESVDNLEIRQDLYILITENKKEFSKSIDGLKAEISLLVMSEFGGIFNKKNSLNLLEAVRDKKIILVNLDGQTFSESSKKFGRMLLGDLRAVSGALVTNSTKEQRPQFTVIVDEFSDIVANEDMANTFVGFLNRCRGSGIGVIIAHQSLGDFKDDKVKAQVLDSTGTLFSFVTKDPETAEMLSAIAGTKLEMKVTEQTSENILFKTRTGMGTQRETHEYLIHPNEFKMLDIGEAIYIAKKPSRHGVVTVKYIEIPNSTIDKQTKVIETEHDQKDDERKNQLNLSGKMLGQKDIYMDAFRNSTEENKKEITIGQLEI